MSVEIRQSELRNDNAAVMRRVARGESFVVTVNGRAVADVVPHRAGTGRRRFVPVSEVAEAFAADPTPDGAAWRADLAVADDLFEPDDLIDPFSPGHHDPDTMTPDATGTATTGTGTGTGTGTRRRALLDTSVLIDFPAAQVAAAADEIAVSVVTIAELQYGVTAAADPLTQLYRRRRVQSILDRFEVLPFDVAVAEYYGTLAALVRQHGRNPRPRRMDLQIAATAARSALSLLTRNGRDFAGLESALEVIELP